MKNLLSSMTEVLSVLRKDKILVLFSLLPIMIGIILFSFLGTFVYTDGLTWAESLISEYTSSDTWGGVLKYFFVALVTAGFYFLISFGFVLIVSLFASPFNGVISDRTQNVIMGKKSESLQSTFKQMISDFFKTIINEVKKLGFIIFLSVLSVVFSFIPVLIPIGMVISALLMAINFLDYSWSREELSFRGCLSNIKKNFFSYLLSGGFFLIIISIPLLNLFALPFGVIYFTILFSRNHFDKGEILSE